MPNLARFLGQKVRYEKKWKVKKWNDIRCKCENFKCQNVKKVKISKSQMLKIKLPLSQKRKRSKAKSGMTKMSKGHRSLRLLIIKKNNNWEKSKCSKVKCKQSKWKKVKNIDSQNGRKSITQKVKKLKSYVRMKVIVGK